MKKYLPIAIVLACAILFVVGIAQLFKLRFESGDVFPAYSSLRSDPLGTMAFYESLERLRGIKVRRDYSTGNKLPEGPQTVYLHLAASHYDWNRMPEELIREVERYLAYGGRLVITLTPEASPSTRRHEILDDDATEENAKSDEEKSDKKEEESSADKRSDREESSKKKSGKEIEDESDDVKFVSARTRWGFDFTIEPLDVADDVFQSALVENRTELALPEFLEWHSGIVLTGMTNSWQAIYERGTNAVVAERKFGRGSLVIATDSFFLSNEALQHDRHADFLAWLIGASREVVFDEAHLGVVESAGAATLMRKYNLYWVVAAVIFLAGLFVWKNGVSFVPGHADEREGEYVAGKDAAAGFVNLLRRSVPTRDLFATCFAEWKKSAVQTGKYTPSRLQQAEAAFNAETSPQSQYDPIRAYQVICHVLKSNRIKSSPSEQKTSEEKASQSSGAGSEPNATKSQK